MTQETLDRANEITEKISESEKLLDALLLRIEQRKRDIKRYNEGNIRWIPFSKWFCNGAIKKDGKIVVASSIECQTPIDFELDEECINFIINHEKDKISKLKKELEEL